MRVIAVNLQKINAEASRRPAMHGVEHMRCQTSCRHVVLLYPDSGTAFQATTAFPPNASVF